MTGFDRTGYCKTMDNDFGSHLICAKVTNKFLQFSRYAGNDLSTPAPQYYFPGLQDGDSWCLCAGRWVQAHEAGMAPDVILESTHKKALSFIDKKTLETYNHQNID